MIFLILPALLSAVFCAPTWDKPSSQGNQWNGPSQQWSAQWQQQNGQNTAAHKPSQQNVWQPPQPAQTSWQQTGQPAQNSWQPSQPAPDSSCQNGEFRPIDSNPNQFEMCVNGEWVKKNCPPGTTFQAASMSCATTTDDTPDNGKDKPWTQQQQYSSGSQQSNQGNNQWQQQTQSAPQPAANPWQQKPQSMQWQQQPAPQKPAVWQQPNPASWQQIPQNPSPPQQSNSWQNAQQSQPAPWMSWQRPGPMANSWQQPAPNSWSKQPPQMVWKPVATPAPTPEPTPEPATPAPATPQPTTPEPTTPEPTTPEPTTTRTTTTSTTTLKPTTTFVPVDPWVHAFPDKCKSGTRRAVQSNNDAFEVCDNGEWVFMLCAPGTWFDTEVMDCSDGFNLAPAWPVPKDMMPAMQGQMQTMDQNGDSSTNNNMMTDNMDVMNMMPSNGIGPKTDDNMQKFYTNQYGNANMMQQKMPDATSGVDMMQTMQMTDDSTDMMAEDTTDTDDMASHFTDPNLWLHDVREVIIVSVEKCKVGRTRVDDSASRYQECIMNPAGVTMWIRRKCAPGTHFSPWTRNCGKVTFRFNSTYATGDKSDVKTDNGDMPDETPVTMTPVTTTMMSQNMQPNGMDGGNVDMPDDNQMNGDDQMMMPKKTYNPWTNGGNVPWNIATSDSADGQKKKQFTITFQLDRGY